MSLFTQPDGSAVPGVIMQPGLYVTMSYITVPSGTTHDTLLIGPNTSRRYLSITNIDINRATLSFPRVLTTDGTVWQQGYPAEPAAAVGGQGGGIFMEGSGTHQGAVYAISALGAHFCVLEG